MVIRVRLLAALAMFAVGPGALEPCGSQASAGTFGYACCKVCKKGKACGDSCIARDKQCHQPRGCACDG